MAIHFFISFLTSLLMMVTRIESVPSLASQSDFGMFKLKSSGNDAHIYFKNKLDMVNKVHVIMSISFCQCIACSDIQKINQIDYMGAKDYVFSFATYVNDGKFGQNRSKCMLSTADLQARTSLAFNMLGTPQGLVATHRRQEGSPQDDPNSLFLDLLKEIIEDGTEGDTYLRRIEGAVLVKGITDFMHHSHVRANSKQIFETDKSGGILFTQGTVMMRPCMLWPWYEPWILDSYGDALSNTHNYRFKYTLPYDQATRNKNIPYFTEDDAKFFNGIVDKMKRMGVIKDKHLANIQDNTGSNVFVKTFDFQAVFIPHRYTEEFVTLMAPFAVTYLSPYLYVPFVFEMMWDSNEWIQMRSERNNTIYAVHQRLLTTCMVANIDDTMLNINEPIAAEMFYFAYGWCGGYPDISYVVERSTMYVMYHFYEAMFFVFLSLILCVCCCMFNKRMIKCCAFVYANMVVCLCGRCGKTSTAYVRVKNQRDNEEFVDPSIPLSTLEDDNETDDHV